MNNSRKHIIIAGVPTAGKTTLCSYLAQSLKYQHLTMDAIVKGLEVAFPETGVKHTDCWEFIPTSKQLIAFIKKISSTSNYDKLPYRLAFDMYHITPQEYAENINKECCDIYFLGYPNISLEEKYQQIRKYDTIYDWTCQREENVLKKHIKDYIEISKWFQKECEKYELPFVDVSENREERLKELARKIINIGN